MATTLLIGQPGAGKTSAAMERIMLPHFASNPQDWLAGSKELGEGIVVTNVPVKRDRWIEEFGEEAVNERLFVYPEFIDDPETGEQRRPFTKWEDFEPFLDKTDKHGRAPLFVIDEAHECIPKGMRFPVNKQTGQREDTFPNRLLLLFTRQRHYLASFCLISQDPFSVAPDILKQVHSTLYIENAEMKGNARAYTVKIWNKAPPRNFADVTFDKCDDAERKPKAYSARAQEFFVSNSKTKTSTVGRSLEGRYKHARSIWRRPAVLVMIPAVGGLLYFGSSILSIGDKAAAEAPSKIAEAPAVANSPAAARSAPKQPEFRPDMEIADLETVALQDTMKKDREAEASFTLSLHSSYGRIPPSSEYGPIVAVKMVDSPEWHYRYLARYASYYGYVLSKIDCGWQMSRPGVDRHLYDSQCLGVQLNESIQPKPSAAASSAIQLASGTSTEMERAAPGCPKRTVYVPSLKACVFL